jgi:SAM-dependent methyltransferase
MINVYKKLEIEGLLKKGGALLDLGCGEGRGSEPFLQSGYTATLVDQNSDALSKAGARFGSNESYKFNLVTEDIRNFAFTTKYDGINIMNVLPFLNNKEDIKKLVSASYDSLNSGGFLFFTVFGNKDQWASEKTDSMCFYTMDEAMQIVDREPYFISEDFGKGITRKGDMKVWNVLHFLYIKERD